LQLSFFLPEELESLAYQIFLTTKVGQLYQALPLDELAKLLPPEPANKVGAPSYFSAKGKVALQFLKMYEGCSDEKLLERINADWTLQMFCGIQLKAHERIRDRDLIWKIRKYVAEHLSIEEMQALLIEHWKGWMDQTHIGMCDATCYESYIKYPTNVKLLWDCNVWLQSQIKHWAKQLGVRRPRNKFTDHRKRQSVYAKKKRKTRKEDRRRTKALLYLCNKQLGQLADLLLQWQMLEEEQRQTIVWDEVAYKRFVTIKKICDQQQRLLDHPEENMGDRIVSLYKPYIHPIVRGKENKRVEFGAKVNSWQVDGLNFIEHLWFRAFHEGNRLNNGIALHRKYFGKLTMLAADLLYATNANRKLCTKLNIQTSFKPKGRRKQDDVLRQQQDTAMKTLGVARSTILEGSYGNDKNHYGLRKINARTELTEVAWIFFGMMTANAMKIAKRQQKSTKARLTTRAA
jgi:IS5 family transposase